MFSGDTSAFIFNGAFSGTIRAMSSPELTVCPGLRKFRLEMMPSSVAVIIVLPKLFSIC